MCHQAAAPAAAAAAAFASCCCYQLLLLLLLLSLSPAANPSAAGIDARFGESLESIASRSPYKSVREAVLAAAGETKVIVCSFDSEFSVSKGWRSTFYSPVTWYVFNPSVGREVAIDNGAAAGDSGADGFVYRIGGVATAAPSSLLVMEKVPKRLSGHYYICRTSLRPASVQAFYLKVIDPVLLLLRPAAPKLTAPVGGRLVMRCDSGDSYPLASVHWTRRRKHRQLPEPHVLAWGPTYEIAAVTGGTADYVYTCHVNNNVNPERSASYEVELSSGTRAQPGSIAATYNGVQAAFRESSRQAQPQYLRTFTASCRTKGTGVTFKWYRNSSLLAPYGDPNLYMFTATAGEYKVSDLIIRKFRQQDRGVYECEAANAGGKQKFAFFLDTIRDLPTQLSVDTEAADGSADAAAAAAAAAGSAAAWQSPQSAGSGWQQHYGDVGGSGVGVGGYGEESAPEAGGGFASGYGEAPSQAAWRRVI